MESAIVQGLVTALLSGGAAWVAVKVEIRWILKTLDRHENYHNFHFKNGNGDRRDVESFTR